MPDKRRHRGPHPRDRELFAPEQLPALTAAVAEHSFLLSRGYSALAALALVGDRHQLVVRQRVAVARAACSDAALERRRSRRTDPRDLAGAQLAVDGFNAIISLEVALGGGVGLLARDGARRDLASVHGSYRRVLETPRAVELLLRGLRACRPEEIVCYLDRPVSNSGKLAKLLREGAEAAGLSLRVELTAGVDRCVSQAGSVAVSADSAVLDAAERWCDVAGWMICERVPGAWTLDFTGVSLRA